MKSNKRFLQKTDNMIWTGSYHLTKRLLSHRKHPQITR